MSNALPPAPIEPSAAERAARNAGYEPDPGKCNACGRTNTKRAPERKSGVTLWLCVDYGSCMREFQPIA